MSEERFAMLLYIIVSDVIKSLVSQGVPQREAIRGFYRSRLYDLLSDKETGIWHTSTNMLLSLYEQEKQSGSLPLNFCI